jgi:Uma2 family endonuclease
MFASYGVPEYWIVDPDARTFEARVLTAGRYGDPLVLQVGQYESPTQPGLVLRIAALFVGLE